MANGMKRAARVTDQMVIELVNQRHSSDELKAGVSRAAIENAYNKLRNDAEGSSSWMRFGRSGNSYSDTHINGIKPARIDAIRLSIYRTIQYIETLADYHAS